MTAFQKAALREKRRMAAVAALKALEPHDAQSRKDVANLLNAAGIVNHIGRSWNVSTVYNFVRMHEEVRGERLVPWLNIGHAGMGKTQTPETVAAKDKRRSRREALLRFVRGECGTARSYDEAAKRLNDAGLPHDKGGPWTAARVMVLAKGCAYRTGEALLPSVRRAGKKWGPKGKRLIRN
jgi:hypothetical protein